MRMHKILKIVFYIYIAFNICILIVNLYELTIEGKNALYIDYGRSYIKGVFCEDNTIHYTASLCIRNRRPTRVKMDRLELIIYGKDGNEKNCDHVLAEITSPSFEEVIIFLPLWSKRIECTFDITDFGTVFSLDRIRYIDTYPGY
ncbi:MAG: hypothetical protein IJG63_08170 [Oscillospiraceae bacterium]|nr:hypothetical protein [Oscillospiraceae bacterium]